ncbi:MAG: bifunctional riboflavin kinase/FAD synthetase [Deltaproteobacteria bacterium]|nr:bifunctional riboflavin kinase/FAD synthetase [Deltaproteobacteria bacterium]MBN2688916.1 bifunctional riboflavin kinase/FAD synthetase [Deltaproteobacteria bacterium]
MIVIRNIEEIPDELHGAFVTIGNFDGIHRGHQRIFRTLIEEAARHGRKTVVITFDPHPQKVLKPERRPFFLLTPLDEKLQLLEKAGIDAVILITFTLKFARTNAETFVRSILWDRLHLAKLFIGYDYVFGKDKQGNADFLRTMGEKLGFDVEEIVVVKEDDTIASSTAIREAICDGDVKLARTLLGRPYNVNGTVVKGFRRGTDIGIPTANIQSEKVIPPRGVYAVITEVEGRKHQGVINIGYNPTFGNNQLSIEVHLFDFHETIYDKHINIFFIDRLRDEMKFESAEKLVEQIRKDIKRTRSILEAYELESGETSEGR